MSGERLLTACLASLVLAAGCTGQPGAPAREDPRDRDLGGAVTVVGTARDSALGALVEGAWKPAPDGL